MTVIGGTLRRTGPRVQVGRGLGLLETAATADGAIERGQRRVGLVNRRFTLLADHFLELGAQCHRVGISIAAGVLLE